MRARTVSNTMVHQTERLATASPLSTSLVPLEKIEVNEPSVCASQPSHSQYPDKEDASGVCVNSLAVVKSDTVLMTQTVTLQIECCSKVMESLAQRDEEDVVAELEQECLCERRRHDKEKERNTTNQQEAETVQVSQQTSERVRPPCPVEAETSMCTSKLLSTTPVRRVTLSERPPFS